MKHSVCDDSNIQKSAEALAHSVFSCCYFPIHCLMLIKCSLKIAYISDTRIASSVYDRIKHSTHGEAQFITPELKNMLHSEQLSSRTSHIKYN